MQTTELHIWSGYHAGAVIAVGDVALRIGTGPDCDVVLGDAGLAAHHFTLCRTADADMMIIAEGGSVRVDDEYEIGPGFRAAINGTATVTAGPVRMVLDISTPMPVPPGRRRGLLLVLACAGILIGAKETGSAATDLRPAVALAAPDAGASEIQALPAALAVSEPADTPLMDRPVMLAQVAEELDRLGLSQLTVRQSGSVVEVDGTVPLSGHADWNAFQRWFDGHFPQAVLRTTKVVLATGAELTPAFPAIQSIWTLNSTPYAIIGGSRVHPGDELPGGWTVIAIADTGVTLRHGGRDWRVGLPGTDAAR